MNDEDEIVTRKGRQTAELIIVLTILLALAFAVSFIGERLL